MKLRSILTKLLGFKHKSIKDFSNTELYAEIFIRTGTVLVADTRSEIDMSAVSNVIDHLRKLGMPTSQIIVYGKTIFRRCA